ncbi:sushi, von Willebrand factor type A, EGF and pentraxin domain-containing protein 1 [Strongylocentrotus purpuratus]|uniref:Sushi, von Willebrand factor type A, EGF and pentraxin domain-containing protein 1-like n=1 Tax=Strongylocentrotus purpuratus TaxID=7668 RepID=A0A7M7P4Z7_STRPU|nr:sushi, von Willebrand factor type A, EGF and pentraxin domain-containing protein 1 [Strongylocentrotus purpuratus]
MKMSAEAGRTGISSCLLCLFFILMMTGSSDAWRRRRRRRAPPPPPPDTTAPTFTYCPNAIGNQYTTTTSMTVPWRTPTATDDRGSATVSITSGSGPGSTFAAGSRSTIYTARDSAGNQATCTVSFTVIVIRCSSLSRPAHGSVSCSNSANVGSRCTYSCTTGYRTSGGSVTRVCIRSGNSGTWSGSVAACVRISCLGPLSSPSNGQISCSDSSNYNSLCSVSCNEGYTLHGSSSRSCGVSGIWSGSNPSCADTTAPVFTRCPPSQTVYAPALSSSATISWSAPTVSDNSGESITPRLDRGSTAPGTSRPVGTHAVAYVAGDSSGNEASCRFSVTVAVIRCSSLSASAPLQVACPNGAIRGSVCTYGCGVGYSLQGQRSTECQKSGSAGSWSQPPPTCQILQCPSMVAPSHGRIVGACSRNYGSRCNFACDTGYEISNSAQQCSARAGSTDAIWVGSTPTCTRIYCRKPSLTTALQITTTQACPYGNQVPSGTQCHFSCSAGYYLTGYAALTCQHDRTWNRATPTCRLITCSGSDLPAPVNGEKRGCSSSRENYGAVCTMACNVGYLPATPIQRTCSDDGNGDGSGVWAGTDLTCTIVTCPVPATPSNGRVTGCLYGGSPQGIDGRQKYSTACSMVCSQGFTKTGGSARRVCQATGQWDGQQIVCEDTTLPVFVCPSNKRLFAGEDSTSAPVPWSDWEPVMGTDRGSPLQATMYTVDSVEVGAAKPTSLLEGTHRVAYRGTDLAGQSTTCSFEIEVKVSRCAPIPIPEHGSVSLVSGTGRCEEGPVFGADCRVACEAGYRLSSDTDHADRVCQRLTDTSQSGFWTGQNEICNVKNCTVPTVTNGLTEDCSRPKASYRTICQFHCRPGFMAPSTVETVSRTCRADEAWSGQDLQCTVTKTCPASFDVAHGGVDPPECESADAVRFSTRCEFSCDEGYQIQGPTALACSTEGEWNHEVVPHCKDIQPPSFSGPCPHQVTVAAEPGTLEAHVHFEEPVPTDNSGHVNLTSLAPTHVPGSIFQEGDTNIGYLATDSSGLASRCDVVITVEVYRCPPEQPPLHGKVEGCPDPFHGSQCQYSCDVGYDLIGEDTLSCDLSPDTTPVWSHDRPVCQIRTCPALVIQAPATLTGCGQSENVPYGSVCIFHCPLGYEGVGESDKRCQADRTWSSTDFTCSRKSCPALVETAWISIRPESCLSNPRFEDTCNLACRTTGYEISPSSLSQTMCSGNQTWTQDVGQAQCVDIEAPTFDDCPADIVAYTERGLNQTHVQWLVQASDNSGSDPRVTCDLHAGVITSGTYTVTCTARDGTGNENICRFLIDVIVRKCPKAFEPPLFGTMTGSCDRSHGSVCHLTCLVGYSLVGSAEASCEFNGTDMYWNTEEEPYCQVIGCDPLVLDSSVFISPPSCGSSEKVHSGTNCMLHCDLDLTLVGGLESLTCLDSGQWSSGLNVSGQSRCLDLAAPTLTSCPSQPIMAVRTEFWGVEVTFDLPSAVDNIDNDLGVSTYPIDLTTPYNFTADTTCSFSFSDQSNNTALCVFQVYVTNEVQPIVQFCPPDQNITTLTKMTEVEWDDPVFLTPPGIDIIETCNYGNNPALLPWGHHVILYQASDSRNGLKAECDINVDIKPVSCHNLHIPAHGALACDDGFAYGRYCTMVCNEGYDVPRLRSMEAPKKLFICGSSGVWYPHANVPDCSQRRKPRRMNLPLSMMYFEGKCGAGENQTIHDISEKFVSIISNTNFAAICAKNQLCKVDHIRVTCGPGNDRRKRDVISERLGEETGRSGIAAVSMVLSMALGEDQHDSNESQAEIMYKLAKHIHHHTKDSLLGGSGGISQESSEENQAGPLYGGRSGISQGPSEENQAGPLDGGSSRISHESSEENQAGPLDGGSSGISQGPSEENQAGLLYGVRSGIERTPIEEQQTAGIDFGLWFDDLVSECDEGYIPDHDRQTCIACPTGHYFHQSSGECVECERGFYQDEQAQSQCKPCVDGTFTREWGARSTADCEVQCTPGYYSPSGFAPCIPCGEGQFLPMRGHSGCFNCPPGLSSPRGSASPWDCKEPFPPGQ